MCYSSTEVAPARPRSVPKAGSEARAHRSRRVLVTEDEADVAMLIRFHLEREGWEVVTAENGLQALGHIREDRPDLLITDVMMPEMNGFELIASLLRDPDLTDLPVIVLTGKAVEDTDVLQAYEMGVYVYLTKPFRAEEIVTLAERMMSEAALG